MKKPADLFLRLPASKRTARFAARSARDDVGRVRHGVRAAVRPHRRDIRSRPRLSAERAAAESPCRMRAAPCSRTASSNMTYQNFIDNHVCTWQSSGTVAPGHVEQILRLLEAPRRCEQSVQLGGRRHIEQLLHEPERARLDDHHAHGGQHRRRADRLSHADGDRDIDRRNPQRHDARQWQDGQWLDHLLQWRVVAHAARRRRLSRGALDDAHWTRSAARALLSRRFCDLGGRVRAHPADRLDALFRRRRAALWGCEPRRSSISSRILCRI